MRVLIVANSVYEQSLYAKTKHISGLAVMVREICDEISKECECYVLPFALTNKRIITLNKLHILPSGINIFIKYLTLKVLLQCFVALFSKNIRRKIRQNIIEKYFFYLHNKYRFDLINLHDFTPENYHLIEICENIKIPYVITMHAYVGEKNVLASKMKQYEIFQHNCKSAFNTYPNIKVVTVSSGMKKRISDDFPNYNANNITVILNSSKYVESILNIEYEQKHEAKKKFLIIGNVQPSKNQIQLFPAIKYISESLLSEIEFHFIGNDKEGVLNKKIKEYGLENTCKYLGIIPHKDLAEHYNNSFATISLSLLESFGLTFIESFAFGKPVIMFDDLDAFEDIYTEDCCVPITEHTDEAVANAIINCVNKTWDEAKIKQHAKKFNMDTLRESYISLYNNILNNDTTENNSRNRL